eukprot:COSAG02_NODE_63926_length_262_cov_0.595092_1_plen_62_part_10
MEPAHIMLAATVSGTCWAARDVPDVYICMSMCTQQYFIIIRMSQQDKPGLTTTLGTLRKPET